MRRFFDARRVAKDHVVGMGPLSVRQRILSPLARLDEAEAFLLSYARNHDVSPQNYQRRWADVRRSLLRNGHYDHTTKELAYGAKLAWRNHARCIGRLFWDGLELRDRRHMTEPDAMFVDVCDHLSKATSDGRIRPIITVYPALRPNSRASFIENAQIVQYAGYLGKNGHIIGDRKNIELTRIAQSMGWTPKDAPSAFDILPVLMRDTQDHRHMFPLPQDAVREVPIRHPTFPALQDLSLRWYAVPLVSDLFLTIGGIDYPCAPFNGFYMATEIASRNLVDRDRYDLLTCVARCFDLDPDDPSPLWRDTTLTELNRAVLDSYQKAGVTLVDHHTASDQYKRFHARETAAGRSVSANWAWIVPPQASAACDVFHLPMEDHHAVPNFYRNRYSDGQKLGARRKRPNETIVARCANLQRRYDRIVNKHG